MMTRNARPRIKDRKKVEIRSRKRVIIRITILFLTSFVNSIVQLLGTTLAHNMDLAIRVASVELILLAIRTSKVVVDFKADKVEEEAEDIKEEAEAVDARTITMEAEVAEPTMAIKGSNLKEELRKIFIFKIKVLDPVFQETNTRLSKLHHPFKINNNSRDGIRKAIIWTGPATGMVHTNRIGMGTIKVKDMANGDTNKPALQQVLSRLVMGLIFNSILKRKLN